MGAAEQQHTGDLGPIDGGLYDGNAQALRQEDELHIKTPPLQPLVAVQRPRRRPREQLLRSTPMFTTTQSSMCGADNCRPLVQSSDWSSLKE